MQEYRDILMKAQWPGEQVLLNLLHTELKVYYLVQPFPLLLMCSQFMMTDQHGFFVHETGLLNL